MKIIVDTAIPLANDLFAQLGELQQLPGREIAAAHCQDADVLLVRSITPVNADLLQGSRVSFVGTCTIGTDHLDIPYLETQHIRWASAPGCNANAVVQYVLSAMAATTPDWQQKTVGIIGCGNIGSRLYRCLTLLGVRCVCYDPFLASQKQPLAPVITDMATVLQADIITCHTPLSYDGPYPTHHLLAEEQLRQLLDDALLINSSRGAVVDNSALLRVLQDKPLQVVLDVWENEPDINTSLLQQVTLATPHIAGYTQEGKARGSFMIYQRLCAHMGIDATLPNCPAEQQPLLYQAITPDFNRLLLACYDIQKDNQQLRAWQSSDRPIGHYFDSLRRSYVHRHEYTHFLLPDSIRHSASIYDQFQHLCQYVCQHEKSGQHS